MFLSHPAPSKRKKRGPLLHPLEKAIGWSADISVFDFKLDCLGLCSERRKSVKQASEAMRGGQAWLGDDMDQSCNRMPQDATDRMPQDATKSPSLPLSLCLGHGFAIDFCGMMANQSYGRTHKVVSVAKCRKDTPRVPCFNAASMRIKDVPI